MEQGGFRGYRVYNDGSDAITQIIASKREFGNATFCVPLRLILQAASTINLSHLRSNLPAIPDHRGNSGELQGL